MWHFLNIRARGARDEALPLPTSSPLPGNSPPSPALAESDPERTRKLTSIVVSTLKVWWTSFKETLGTGSALSDSLLEHGEFEHVESINAPLRTANITNEKVETRQEDPIDEIVVDNLLASDGETHRSPTDPGEPGTDGSPEKSHGNPPAPTSTGYEEVPTGVVHIVWTALRWRLYPNIYRFFLLRFYDEQMEVQFRREAWFTSKRLALCASLFYVLNWLIGCVLLPKPHPLMERIFYWGIAPVLTLPLPLLVAFDIPRRYNAYYQIYVTCSTWSWTFYQSLFLILCGYYNQKSYFSCGSKDFLGLLYYASALPAIALFGLGQQRLPAMIPAMVILVIMAIWIVPYRHTWARSTVNVFVFQMFLLWLHYLRENADRRLYSLREQLKVQFRATQKAQVNERKTADSKRRLTSYIFHEVRVPLNTAMLAVQNMEAHGSVPKGQDIEFAALEGSLSMMSKVLNDVLDFNRMDSGRFESVSRPYSFHTVLRSMFVPLQLAADARGLELDTEIDRRIDEVARKAWYQARGEVPEWIEEKLLQVPGEEGIVVGDEMRLRQIVTNLASNACKFTPSGGKISVRTRLIVPSLPNQPSNSDATSERPMAPLDPNGLSAHRLHQHNSTLASAPLESIVVRIEIQDTGVGIKSRDLVDNKLFSPYVQTEIGRTQGGKGTGLGLALVRHIVKLSGGRLGVRSQLGVGSTFWVELRLGVGKKALLRHGGIASDSDRAFRFSRPSLQNDQTEFQLSGAAATLRSIDGLDTAPAGDRLLASVSAVSPSLGEAYVGFLPLLPSHAASALKTIMEQGGLVELAPRRPVREGTSARILTGASAGTDDPMAPSPPALAGTTLPQSDNRPTYIPMPERDSMSFFTTFPSTPSIPPSPSIQRALTRASFSSSEPSSHQESTLRALVVDDDYVTRHLMNRLLTRLGVSVTCAENGAIALDLILGIDGAATTPGSEKASMSLGSVGSSPTYATCQQEHRFDIIYLDNQMPVMSGLDVVRRLREMGRTDFVVGVTGNALLSDQNEYIEAGVNKVLTKPVHERSLKSALDIADQLKKQRSLSVLERSSVSPGLPKALAPDKNEGDLDKIP